MLAHVDVWTIDGDGITVEGHLRDERPIDAALDPSPVLVVGDQRFGAAWVERPDRARRYGLWSGFRARVPVPSWPRGAHRLQLVVGDQELTVRKTRGFFRHARLGAHGDVAVDLRAAGTTAIVELVDGGARAARRLRRRSDLRALARRSPLAGWRVVRLVTWWIRPVWLVGERRDTAQDNGAALFTYLRRERPDVRARYVLDRRSPAWDRLAPLGGLVAHGSWRHRLLMWHASHLVNAFDTDVYGIPSQWRRDDYVEHVRPRVGTRRVFLQHGVVYRDLTSMIGSALTGYDVVLSSAETERRWLAERFGYGDRVHLTGMPRHDALERRPEGTRVLLAPTWRDDLVVPGYREGATPGLVEGALDSPYVRFMQDVVEHPELAAALERHDARLEVLPHYEAVGLFEQLATGRDRTTVVDQRSVAFQDVLCRASVFVTDYSSTLFDAALLGLPVVAAHFDPAFEAAGSPQAVDLRQLGFGPVTSTADDTVAAIVAYLDAGCRREPERDERVTSFFAFGTSGCSARAVAAIEKA